jgi:hypothetical protein
VHEPVLKGAMGVPMARATGSDARFAVHCIAGGRAAANEFLRAVAIKAGGGAGFAEYWRRTPPEVREVRAVHLR